MENIEKFSLSLPSALDLQRCINATLTGKEENYESKVEAMYFVGFLCGGVCHGFD